MNIFLRVLPFFIGAVLSLLFIKGVANLAKTQLFVAAFVFMLGIGYFFTRYNIWMMRRTGELSGGNVLSPNKLGHVALIIGALVVGYAFSTKLQLMLFVGLALIWYADDLLTKTTYSPLDALRAFQETPAYWKTMELSNVLGIWFTELTQEKIRNSEIKDLKVSILPEKSEPGKYSVTVTNTGGINYRNIAINLNNILADADSFGIDITHMTDDSRYSAPCIWEIQNLGPKQSMQEVFKGYGSHENYSRSRLRYAKVTLPAFKPGPDVVPNWCEVSVNLPSASNQ